MVVHSFECPGLTWCAPAPAQIEDQRSEQQRQQQEKQVLSKLERVKQASGRQPRRPNSSPGADSPLHPPQDQETRTKALEQEARQAEIKAMLIEQNLALVDAAIGAVNGALASGMAWKDLQQMVRAGPWSSCPSFSAQEGGSRPPFAWPALIRVPV